MSPVEIDFLGEGLSDEAVARKVILAVAAEPGKSWRRPLAGTGKNSLNNRLSGLNAGLQFGGPPILVVRDLDHDAGCPAELVSNLISDRHPNLVLRVCVRETESWLMADFDAYARHCGIAPGQVPSLPESIDDPKQCILNWADSGRASKLKRHVEANRRKGVPDWAILGLWHAEFAENVWSPLRAEKTGRAPSLTRALLRLEAVIKKVSQDELKSN
jgi:hypothetical protein